ncbi:hypothetical protein SSX86_010173 [Deinandra increscens subsp. villosa]|uniref:Protein kinase domain-containing protein n=1 Tax=Deinandra increscens subsp. villosa TaxID=3103831 RepID=A0AAP0H2Z2_9ASTR
MFFAIGNGKEFDPSTSSTEPCRHFEFSEILIATENFDESFVIGSGGFGKVYKGNVIIAGSLVVAAIKRLDSMSSQGAGEFWAEVEMLSMLRHCNLVSLIGYCNYEKEMILVYEYMPNGTLSDHLHLLNTPLSWLQRLQICIGAGRGLHYLHTGTGIQYGVIHRDVKSSNILLHESWAAKVSDFGLSKIGPTNQASTNVKTLVKGTFGYLDPNYYATGNLTRKSDVYAFGVVLLEVLCRKHAVDTSLDEEQWSLVGWVQDSVNEGNIKKIIDPDIRGEISPKCLKEFVRIAESCFHSNPKQRPTMAEVVFILESVLALQEKFDNSLQVVGRTIFGRMVGMLPFTSNRENTVEGDSKLSSNMVSQTEGVHAHCQGPSPSLKVFKFADLKKATRKFSPDLLLGEGGSGKVFLGWVKHKTLAPSKQGVGTSIAVKRLNKESAQRPDEWLVEVNFLGHITHPHIIRLLGYCRDEHEHLLVYEYMSNKSLQCILSKDEFAKLLSWETRLLIMIGVARGLAYLHSRDIIHGDLTSSNILLNDDFNAKLKQFRMMKYGPETGETHISTDHLTIKSDIYSLGVVLLECITGQKESNLSEVEVKVNALLVDCASEINSDTTKLKEIMDPRFEHNYSLQGALGCFALVLRCIAKKLKNRPSSEEVLESLEQIYSVYK